MLPSTPRRQHLLGLLLTAEGLLDQEAVGRILDEQARRRTEDRFHHFGQVASDMGMVEPEKLAWALQLQDQLAFAAQERDRLGYMLLEAGLVRPSQILVALERQAKDGGLLGEILVEAGHLDAAGLEGVLQRQVLGGF